MKLPVALTIAGSDPSGGAGIQADLKTFHQFGVYGQAVITLLTVQNSQVVSRVEVMRGDLVREQVQALLTDIPPAAAKTGALGNTEVIEAWSAPAIERCRTGPAGTPHSFRIPCDSQYPGSRNVNRNHDRG